MLTFNLYRKILLSLFYFVILFGIFTETYAYNMPYVCTDDSCNGTNSKDVDIRSVGKFISTRNSTVYSVDKFENYIRDILQKNYYEKYYKVSFYGNSYDITAQFKVEEDKEYKCPDNNNGDNGGPSSCSMPMWLHDCQKKNENTWSCKELNDRNFDFPRLLDYSDNKKPIKFNGVSYTDGYKFILDNFSDVIQKFNDGVGCGYGTCPQGMHASKDIKELIKVEVSKTCRFSWDCTYVYDYPIMSYNDGNFTLKRTCDNNKCIPSSSKSVPYNSQSKIWFLIGKVMGMGNLGNELLSNGGLQKLYNGVDVSTIKVGETIKLVLKFNVILNTFLSDTNTKIQYFFISNVNGEEKEEFSETIKIEHNFGTPYLKLKVHNPDDYSPGKKDSEGYVKLSDIDDFGGNIKIEKYINDFFDSKVTITIEEPIALSKAGNTSFYLKAKNLTEGFEIEPEALGGITVVSDYNVSQSEFNFLEENFLGHNDKGYYINEKHPIKFKLIDKYGNDYCDAEGYKISFSKETLNILSDEGKSGALLISAINSDSGEDWGKEILFEDLNGNCKSDGTFYMKATKPGRYSPISFNVAVRKKNGIGDYINEYFTASDWDGNTIINFVPKELENDSLNILSGEQYNMSFKCTNQNIVLTRECTTDKVGSAKISGASAIASGCNGAQKEIYYFIDKLGDARIVGQAYSCYKSNYYAINTTISNGPLNRTLVDNSYCSSNTSRYKLVTPLGTYDLASIPATRQFAIQLYNYNCKTPTSCVMYEKVSGSSNWSILKSGATIYSSSLPITSVQGNNSTGAFTIVDNARNTHTYQYFMDHIDKIPPQITLRKGGQTLALSGAGNSFKVADDFELEIFEETTRTCLKEASFDVDIKLTTNGATATSIKKGTIGYVNGVLKTGTPILGDLEKIEEIEIGGKYGIKYTLDLSEWLTKAGTNTISISGLKDRNGNLVGTQNYQITIYPTDENLFDDLNCSGLIGNGCCVNGKVDFWDLNVSGKGTKYANNSDYYKYVLTLRDKYCNPIFNKSLVSVIHDYNSQTGLETICLDETTKTRVGNSPVCKPTNSNAITLTNSTNSNASGSLTFDVKSYTPGTFSEFFNGRVRLWDDEYKDISTTKSFYFNLDSNKFLKPISIKDILVSNNSSGALCSGSDAEWKAEPSGSNLQKYRIMLSNSGSSFNISNGILDIDNGNIKDIGKQNLGWVLFEGVEKSFSGPTSTITGACLGFKGRIDQGEIGTAVKISNGNPEKPDDEEKVNDLPISYKFDDGKSVKYYLDQFGGNTGACLNQSTLGVKVIGQLQSDGKAEATGQEENFSDLSTAEMRAIIKRNATELTKGMKNGNIVVNGVKYVEGNITLPDNDFGKYETIIVKNGNVFINQNIIPASSKPLGIIVLKDAYNVNIDWNVAGNVYVFHNVETINAVIYADGALRSAKDALGTPYSPEEDIALNKPLDVKGSLFTRNTIGGATQLAGISYLLPGGRKLAKDETSLLLAERYDLNYVRKVELCDLDDYSLKITYDPKVQTNPPKGFK